MEPQFIEECSILRAELKKTGERIKKLKKHSDLTNEQSHPDQHGEMIANSVLAYRHLEDCVMRLGKCIQARDGGVSCYDK